MELAQGIWRANTAERAAQRRIYLPEVCSAVQVQPFTREMAERAARIDADACRTGKTIPLADLQIGVTALEPGYAIGTYKRAAFRDDSRA